mmetsp:Transcript_82349/g.197495  ORF Transcript_82349/g.197495 Transcript_82349/m.197495 type:complete len:478 (-) Transcript_82349:9298-10731(-)
MSRPGCHLHVRGQQGLDLELFRLIDGLALDAILPVNVDHLLPELVVKRPGIAHEGGIEQTVTDKPLLHLTHLLQVFGPTLSLRAQALDKLGGGIQSPGHGVCILFELLQLVALHLPFLGDNLQVLGQLLKLLIDVLEILFGLLLLLLELVHQLPLGRHPTSHLVVLHHRQDPLQQAVAGPGDGLHLLALEDLLLLAKVVSDPLDLLLLHLVLLILLQRPQETHIRQHGLRSDPALAFILLAQGPQDANAHADDHHGLGRRGHGLDLRDVLLVQLLQGLGGRFQGRQSCLQRFVGIRLLLLDDDGVFLDLLCGCTGLFFPVCHRLGLLVDDVNELSNFDRVLIHDGFLLLELLRHLSHLDGCLHQLVETATQAAGHLIQVVAIQIKELHVISKEVEVVLRGGKVPPLVFHLELRRVFLRHRQVDIAHAVCDGRPEVVDARDSSEEMLRHRQKCLLRPGEEPVDGAASNEAGEVPASSA